MSKVGLQVWKQKHDGILELTGTQVLQEVLIWKKEVQMDIEVVVYASGALNF